MCWISVLALVFCLVVNLISVSLCIWFLSPIILSLHRDSLVENSFFSHVSCYPSNTRAVTELGTPVSSCRLVQCRCEVQQSAELDPSCPRTPKAIIVQNLIKILIHSFESTSLAFPCYPTRVGLWLVQCTMKSALCMDFVHRVALLLLNFLCYPSLNMCLLFGSVTRWSELFLRYF